MSLHLIKLAHTVIWAFFVACILGAPLAAASGEFLWAGVMIAMVALEGVVLFFNRWSCPLTAVAARYTDRREDNFDIYLPRWLARHNKVIFTSIYVIGAIYVLVAWWRHG